MFPLIPITPNPILVQLGPLPIGWYGIGYVVALAVLLLVTQTEVARRGMNPAHVWNALILVGVLALIGGRLYHVIDQWGPLYSQDPLRAILPPYSGLGLYGGVAGAALGIIIYTRWKHVPIKLGLDTVIAGTLFAQGIARWGNFFNQELYGPPTNLPWGIAIDCAHRVAEYPCSAFPVETTGFHPLFFYESALDITGGLIVLFLSRRYLARLQPGDLVGFWGIWYGATRGILETLRMGWNWTLLGIPTAQLVGLLVIGIGIAIIAWNHRPGTKPYPYLPPWKPPPANLAEDESEDDDDEYYDDDDEYEDEESDDEEADRGDDEEEPGGDEEEPGGDEEGPGGDEEEPGGDEEEPGGDEADVSELNPDDDDQPQTLPAT